MIIAVTGGTGFLGRQFVMQAATLGHEVRLLTRTPGLSMQSDEQPATIVEGSIGDKAALYQLTKGADLLVHLAASGLNQTTRSWAECTKVNVIDAVNVIAAAAANAVGQVIAAGTCLEYAGYGRLPMKPWTGDAPPIDEEGSMEVMDPYAASKAAGGLLARARARDSGLAMWYLRFAKLYGAGGHPDQVLSRALATVHSTARMKLTGGDQVREWLHVTDAVRAIVTAASTVSDGVEVLNIGTGVGERLRDVVRRAVVGAGGNENVLDFGALPYRSEPHYLVMDSTRARRRLSWEAKIPLDIGLRELYADHPERHA